MNEMLLQLECMTKSEFQLKNHLPSVVLQKLCTNRCFQIIQSTKRKTKRVTFICVSNKKCVWCNNMLTMESLPATLLIFLREDFWLSYCQFFVFFFLLVNRRHCIVKLFTHTHNTHINWTTTTESKPAFQWIWLSIKFYRYRCFICYGCAILSIVPSTIWLPSFVTSY